MNKLAEQLKKRDALRLAAMEKKAKQKLKSVTMPKPIAKPTPKPIAKPKK